MTHPATKTDPAEAERTLLLIAALRRDGTTNFRIGAMPKQSARDKSPAELREQLFIHLACIPRLIGCTSPSTLARIMASDPSFPAGRFLPGRKRAVYLTAEIVAYFSDAGRVHKPRRAKAAPAAAEPALA